MPKKKPKSGSNRENIPEGGKKLKRPDKKVLVKCMGYGKEHYFMSESKWLRTCPACETKRRLMSPRIVPLRGG